MVLSNSTIEQINYIKDIEYEYNIKLMILFFFVIVAIVSLYFGYKNEYDTHAKSIFNMFLISLGYIIIIFLPIFFIFLIRNVSLDTIINYLFIVYNIFMWGFFMLGLLWLIEKFISHYFGYSLLDKKTKNRKQSEYREVEK